MKIISRWNKIWNFFLLLEMLEKLKYGYIYGADAVYIGLKNFSLRVKADNFYEDEYKKVCELKNSSPEKTSLRIEHCVS